MRVSTPLTQSTIQAAKQTGSTLIEIMVVVVIIGLLSSMIIPNIIERQKQAMLTKAKLDVESYASNLSMYRLDNLSYPTTSQGLQALVSNPGSNKGWKPILDDIELDPWNNEYQYLQPGQRNPSKFDVWSFGADGAPGGEGENKDIGNWKD